MACSVQGMDHHIVETKVPKLFHLPLPRRMTAFELCYVCELAGTETLCCAPSTLLSSMSLNPPPESGEVRSKLIDRTRTNSCYNCQKSNPGRGRQSSHSSRWPSLASAGEGSSLKDDIMWHLPANPQPIGRLTKAPYSPNRILLLLIIISSESCISMLRYGSMKKVDC